jgi:hypothetical protein
LKNLTAKLPWLAGAFLIVGCLTESQAQKPKAPAGGRIAVVIDERLAAVRSTPNLSGDLVRRLSRGRLLAVRGARTGADGVVFFLVNLSSRTHGWIQREAVAAPWRAGDDERLLRMIRNSTEFDLVTRARIFLDYFSRSPSCAEVLQLLGAAAEEVAVKLSRQASLRLVNNGEDAPVFSYFLNYSGLDRYNRQGVRFVFDREARQLHYDGAAWRVIVRRYPRSPQAEEARTQLARLAELMSKQ